MRTAHFVTIAAILAAFNAPMAMSQETAPPPSAPINEASGVDYSGFAALTAEVAAIREDRLLGIEDFTTRAAQPGTLILDTRSSSAFARGHIEGAVNLPFSDFTEESLNAVIGSDKNRMILIYCNNNFSDDVAPIMLKKAPLALNIPTFINLSGYGYTNIWELGDTVSVTDVDWVGTGAEELIAMITKETAALPN